MKKLIFVLLLLCWLAGLSNATEAPGCGNQHYRPRLAQCCPKYLAGEALPPKCTHAEADGFLAQCCGGPTPTPAPTTTQTCPPDWWECQETTPTPGQCMSTPLPTPDSWTKGECCEDALRIYRDTRRDIVRRYRQELRAVTARKQAQMRECREAYGR